MKVDIHWPTIFHHWIKIIPLFWLLISTIAWGSTAEDPIPTVKPALLAEWRAIAMKGNTEMQYMLGNLYLVGEGVEQNFTQAHKWFEMAALQDNTEAQYANAVLHHMNESYELAVSWYKVAALNGHADAQSELALLYETGKGVVKDDKVAFDWYSQAAKGGNAYAQDKLGQFYMMGKIVSKDKKRARRFFRKAARQGFADAYYHLALMRLNDKGELSSNRSDAVLLLKKAVRAGHSKAKEKLLDLASTNTWQELAYQGDAESQYFVGGLYLLGIMVMRDHEQALYWFELAAQQGHLEAQYYTAVLHYLEAEEAPDAATSNHYDKKAIFWLKKAAHADYARAQYKLGTIYEEGRGTPRNRETALHWYRKAAQQGNLDAQSKLNHLLAAASTTAPDFEKNASDQEVQQQTSISSISTNDQSIPSSRPHPLGNTSIEKEKAEPLSEQIIKDDIIYGQIKTNHVHSNDGHRKPSTRELLRALAQQLH